MWLWIAHYERRFERDDDAEASPRESMRDANGVNHTCRGFAAASPSAAGATQVGQRLVEHEQGIAHFLLADGVPVGQFDPAGAARLVNLGRALEFVSFLEIFRIGWIDERADRREGIACADLVARVGVTPRAVRDVHDVVVLVDRHERHKSLARVGQRDRHRPAPLAFVEVEHRQ